MYGNRYIKTWNVKMHETWKYTENINSSLFLRKNERFILYGLLWFLNCQSWYLRLYLFLYFFFFLLQSSATEFSRNSTIYIFFYNKEKKYMTKCLSNMLNFFTKYLLNMLYFFYDWHTYLFDQDIQKFYRHFQQISISK